MTTLKKKVRGKIVNAIIDYDLPRVKRYLRKYNVNVNNSDFDNGATMLHVACLKGQVAIIRYLIKKGANSLLTNKNGELPGHLLADYLMSSAERDNIEDVLDTLAFMKRKCPESFQRSDSGGFTVQMVMDQFVRRNKQQHNGGESGRFNSSSSHSFTATGDKEREDAWEEDRSWEERLRAEMDEDYVTPDWKSYDDDRESETWDGWAARISDEYHNRKRSFGPTRRQQSPHHPDDHEPSGSKSGISDEKKQKFDENLRKNAKLEAAMVSRKKMEVLVKEKRAYEMKCRKLFDSKAHLHHHADDKDNAVSLLRFADIPWPPEGSTDLLEFFGCDIDKSAPQSLQLYVRQQRIRWHPDKFAQRCGHRLYEADRIRIMDRVKTVSQMLNDLVAKLTAT